MSAYTSGVSTGAEQAGPVRQAGEEVTLTEAREAAILTPGKARLGIL